MINRSSVTVIIPAPETALGSATPACLIPSSRLDTPCPTLCTVTRPQPSADLWPWGNPSPRRCPFCKGGPRPRSSQRVSWSPALYQALCLRPQDGQGRSWPSGVIFGGHTAIWGGERICPMPRGGRAVWGGGEAGPARRAGSKGPGDEELRGPLGPGRLQRCGREGAGFSETAATFPKPLWLEVDKSVSLGLRFARVGLGGRPWAGSPGSPFAKGGGVHANGALGSGVLATCCCLSGRPGLAPFRPAPPCGGPARRPGL